MKIIRLFLIQNTEDAKEINKELSYLEDCHIEYEVDYEFEEGMPGILVCVEYNEKK